MKLPSRLLKLYSTCQKKHCDRKFLLLKDISIFFPFSDLSEISLNIFEHQKIFYRVGKTILYVSRRLFGEQFVMKNWIFLVFLTMSWTFELSWNFVKSFSASCQNCLLHVRWNFLRSFFEKRLALTLAYVL